MRSAPETDRSLANLDCSPQNRCLSSGALLSCYYRFRSAKFAGGA